MQALVILQRVAGTLSTGLLEEQLAPLVRRLIELTAHRRLHLGEAAKRIRLPAIASRPVGTAFQNAAAATLQRLKLHSTTTPAARTNIRSARSRRSGSRSTAKAGT